MMDMFSSDSDWDSLSDSGSELEFLYGGHANCILSSLEESIGKIDDFLSFERGFVRGEVVCSVANPSGQMGRVVNVKMVVDLENVHGKIIKAVDSKELLKICSMSVGDYVVNGPWIGRVDKVVHNVTIIFDDGSKCEVIAADKEKLLPVSPNILEDSTYPYYPGQRVQVRLPAVSKTRSLCGAWKENQDVGTVSSVNAGLMFVDWLACALVGCDMSLPAPRHLQDVKDLTLLPCSSYEHWQLGDWCMLPFADFKGVKKQMLYDASTLELIKENDKMGKGFKRQDHSNLEEIFVIVKIKTIVDVLWQDGSCSLELDSHSLLPVNVVNAHEFWPGQYVVEKGACDDPNVPDNRKWGVVSAVDAKERTVKVKWKLTVANQANDVGSNLVSQGETVSAYELVEYPDFSYCYGDIVFNTVDQADMHRLKGETSMGETVAIEGKECGKDQSDYPCDGYLSCIGYVSGFKDGAVEVTWASGLQTKVAPNDIFRIDKYQSSPANSVLNVNEQNIDDVNLNQEMIGLDKQSSSLKGKDLQSSSSNSECKQGSWKASSFFLPRSTIGFFRSIAASIFESFGSTSSCSVSSGPVFKDGNQLKSVEEKENMENNDLCTEMQSLIPGGMQSFENASLNQEVNDIQENKEVQSLFGSKSEERFRQFEMVDDCSDHHFLDDASRGLALSQMKRSWLKKVQQEWSTLEKHLPESIYVRVYEGRMDLLRAAIVGAPGTPYHDGLFFFDIYLPPEYPHEPPLVHYRSGGLRVNPNLYESGKVCLSLLNTWTGTGTEVWSPESNILQVLLSLQALVLNEKPYFNEAGYDKQIGRSEGEKNSVSYNENAFLMTWKSMLYLLRQPPEHFGTLIEEHLKRRSEYILSACKAYIQGAPVAYPFECGHVEHEHQKGNSTGFKIMLSKLFPKLVEAFAAKGIDCNKFAEVDP
ncbi:probable ubiquitin-conjugating enzyme E2 24 isoform X1 [Ricinus communis]|uniref:probable ubiquitin-conjugating enzyme E2 24 isoform X1 n=1 Tax=Ricinus communis TaxID=3988 RepID=UPI00201A26C8|nr:probable ubiquitin-conjugating enzyme E2 24 isoform X1 [Ricinus communis]XP_048230337.1 probable ubiquitin-conjugating enzyme E2 24 isoform X1 [Ricinus communis]